MNATEAVAFGNALVTPDEMAEADRLTIAAGTLGIVLMERAGQAVAQKAAELWRAGRIVVLAGPGNNGGDGWVAARRLRQRGYPVTVATLGDRRRLKGDARRAAARFDGVVVPAEPGLFVDAGMVIDALFGAGIRLPLPREAAALIEAVNGSGATVVAVDLPSGVEGAGGTFDRAAVRADATVTFFRLKPGHVLYPGRALCGHIVLADIGIPAAMLGMIEPAAFLNRPSMWRADMPVPAADGHKYRRGHAVVLSGPETATGAARLAAGAAIRIGAGLVTLASPADALSVNAAQLTAVMLRRIDDAEDLSTLLDDARFNAVVLGPGLGVGEKTRRLVEAALGAGRATVLDADALTSFEGEMRTLLGLIERSGAPVVVTPHDGEFARLVPDITGTRLERARAAAQRSGAVVVLKGADTVVARPDGVAVVNDNAPPYLATAGSGDVLAGMIGGLLAQAMPAWSAAAAAVWLHGEAARAIGPGLVSEDLAGALPAAVAAASAATD